MDGKSSFDGSQLSQFVVQLSLAFCYRAGPSFVQGSTNPGLYSLSPCWFDPQTWVNMGVLTQGSRSGVS